MKISMENSLEKINNAALKFLTPLTPQATYKKIVEEAVSLVDGDEGMILFPQERRLKIVYGSTKLAMKVQPRSRGYAHRAFKTKEAFVIHKEDLEQFDQQSIAAGVRSILFIPLIYKKKSIGVLVVRSHKDEIVFSHKELELLKLFGSFACMAIRKNQLYDEAKKALQVRDLFITTAAHELRTPLTTINGYMQLLKNKITHENFKHFPWFDQLSWEVLRLTLLVNELLAINRIRSGQFQYTWKVCHLRELVRRTISNFTFAYPENELLFEDMLNGKSDIIIADFDKLLQVFDNVLQNAGKYSPPQSKIVIHLKSQRSYYILQIHDQGQGVSKEDLERVFEAFQKGRQNREEGMGLGLYLAKSIVQQHRGRISMTSEVGEGSLVEIKLPKIKI